MHCGCILARIRAKNHSLDPYRYGRHNGRLQWSIVHWKQRHERTSYTHFVRVYCSWITTINPVWGMRMWKIFKNRSKFIHFFSTHCVLCITYFFYPSSLSSDAWIDLLPSWCVQIRNTKLQLQNYNHEIFERIEWMKCGIKMNTYTTHSPLIIKSIRFLIFVWLLIENGKAFKPLLRINNNFLLFFEFNTNEAKQEANYG